MKYFKTDGIRGKTNELITPKLLFKIGRSLDALSCKELYIGYDSRYYGRKLLLSLAIGAESKGIRIINLGVITTPGVMYYSLINKAIGVSITASHNQYYDNGVKIFFNGEKIDDDIENKIEERIDKEKYDEFSYKKFKEIKPKLYLSLLNSFREECSYKFVVDCSNGASSFYAKKIFKHTIASKPNGKNINARVGSTNINYLIEYLNKHKYDYGFALDGDGDRVILADKSKAYYGDDLLYLIIKYYSDLGLKIKNVGMSRMSNIGVVEKIKELCEVSICDVGDKNLKKFAYGAEPSGHLIIKSIAPYADGMLMILLLNKIISFYKKPLDKLFLYERYEELNYNIDLCNVTRNENEINDFINNISNENIENIIIRKSGTENVLRVHISSRRKAEIYKYKKTIDEFLGG